MNVQQHQRAHRAQPREKDLLFEEEKAAALDHLEALKKQLGAPRPQPEPVAKLLQQAATLEAQGIADPLHQLLGDIEPGAAAIDTFLNSPHRLPEE